MWTSAVEVRVTIGRVERGYVGRLGVVQRDSAEHAASERELRATACSSVVEALAISAALAVDDVLQVAAGTEPTPSAERPGAERPEPPSEAVRPPNPAPPRPMPEGVDRPSARTLDLRIGGALGLREGLAPDALWMQTAWLSVGARNTVWPPTVRAELSIGASPVARMAEGAYRTRLFEGGVSACTPAGGGWLALFAVCAGVSGGALATSSFEVIRPAERVRPWFAGFAAPRVAMPVTAGLSFVVEARAVLPFFRESQAFYPGVTVYEAPAMALQGALGLEVGLPTHRP